MSLLNAVAHMSESSQATVIYLLSDRLAAVAPFILSRCDNNFVLCCHNCIFIIVFETQCWYHRLIEWSKGHPTCIMNLFHLIANVLFWNRWRNKTREGPPSTGLPWM